ncbi:50S ribosomal protein L1 [Patescibacteria group bacterium]
MAKKTQKTTHSVRYTNSAKDIDRNIALPINEAIELVKQTANTKFDSSIEVAIKTNIDPRKGDQQVRGTVKLPHGTGKKIKIAVIAPPELHKEAKAAGAAVVGGQEIIDEIAKKGKTNFDILLTVPEMMKDLAKIAKILGPKGLMPNPKTETVTPNIKKAVEELSKGKVNYKNDDSGNVHLAIGKASFDAEKLVENYQTFIDIITQNKPAGVKGIFIKNISISSTMGPGIKVQI